MNNYRLKNFVLFFLTAGTALCGHAGNAPVAWAADGSPKNETSKAKDPALSLSLELRRNGQPSGHPGDPPVQVFIVNKGDTKVTLIQPGQDSDQKNFRSSLVSWDAYKVEKDKSLTKVKWREFFRCGNGGELRASDIFELAPGQSQRLNEWTFAFAYNFDEPGTYRVRFYYANAPMLIWRNEHNPWLMQRVRQTTKCALISDELEFTVPEPASDKK